MATIPGTAFKVLEKTRDAEGTWHIKMIEVSGDKLMPEHPELTPEDREALAQFDDFLASAGDAPPLAHPERFDHPIGLDEEGRKFAGDDDSPDEERSP